MSTEITRELNNPRIDLQVDLRRGITLAKEESIPLDTTGAGSEGAGAAGATTEEILVPESPHADMSILSLVTGSGIVVQGVLILLILMSVVTWGIVIQKWFGIRKAKQQSKEFDSVFWGSKNLAHINGESKKLEASPIAAVFAAGYQELTALLDSGGAASDASNLESIDRSLRKARVEEISQLETGTTFLATTASAAPFIGLFGTVWGIMNAFIGLSQAKSSSIQAVAPGISEALIATAIGLAAAIPAAIFYNYFSQQVRGLARGMDMFSAEFLNISKRHFLK